MKNFWHSQKKHKRTPLGFCAGDRICFSSKYRWTLEIGREGSILPESFCKPNKRPTCKFVEHYPAHYVFQAPPKQEFTVSVYILPDQKWNLWTTQRRLDVLNPQNEMHLRLYCGRELELYEVWTVKRPSLKDADLRLDGNISMWDLTFSFSGSKYWSKLSEGAKTLANQPSFYKQKDEE